MTTAISLGARDSGRPVTKVGVWSARVAIMFGGVGGALSVIGASMPWMSFFAGLQPVSGLSGPSGWMIASLGAIAVAGSVVALLRGGALGRWISGLGGFGVLAVGGWAAVGLLGTLSELAGEPLLVSAIEPGLLIALLGGTLAFAVLFVPIASSGPRTGRTPTRDAQDLAED